MIGQILQTVFGGVLDELQARRERKQARLAADIAIEQARATADIDWDQIMAQGSQTSWKDEFWTIVLAIPAVMAFFPGARELVMGGFATLAEMPIYYQAFLSTAIAAAFGRQELINIATGLQRNRSARRLEGRPAGGSNDPANQD